MEVYTAIPLIPARSSGNGTHLERIRSHNARSVVKVLLVLVVLITLLSVMIAHAIHQEHSHARSLELNGENALIDVEAIQETKNPALDLDGPRPTRYLRGTFDGPAIVHRVIFVDNDSGSIEMLTSGSNVISGSSFVHLEQEVEEMFAVATMTMMAIDIKSFEDFFNGPLSGFDFLDEASVAQKQTAGPCFILDQLAEKALELEEEAEVKRGDTPILENYVGSGSEKDDRDLVEEKDDIPKLVSDLASDEDLSVL